MFLNVRKSTSFLDGITLAILGLIATGLFVLNSISQNLFPQYYFFVIISIILFLVLKRVDFQIYSSFSTQLYVLSIILLVATLIIGQVTRGTVRWIPLGNFAFQPSEVFRAFLFLFFANQFAQKNITNSGYMKLVIVSVLPLFLIFIQPSFGVTLITFAGFLGMSFSKGLNKKAIFLILISLIAGIFLLFTLLKPYQKERLFSFINPNLDPSGAGYNSIQSVISVGSGGLFGRGLGEGVQTQLAFLPEKQTDFIFAAISEEMGFAGAVFVLILTVFIIINLLKKGEIENNPVKKIYVVGVIVTYVAQVFIHAGMNMGILPITGVPFPFLSAGGSSLLGTVIMLAIAFSL